MDINVQKFGEVIVVTLAGEIDGKTAPQAQRTIISALEGEASILIDMTGTRYMSSAGLRMLLLVHREVGARKAKLALCGVSQEIQDVMVATGFWQFFVVGKNLEEGLAVLAR